MSLDAIGIVSKNPQRSIEFYEILGVTLQQEGGPDHFEGVTPSGVRIMLDTVDLMKKLNPNWVEPTGTGIVLCFKQTSASEVDGLVAAMAEAGFKVVKEPWDAFWGQRYASVQDPDGNQIDVFASLTGT